MNCNVSVVNAGRGVGLKFICDKCKKKAVSKTNS